MMSQSHKNAIFGTDNGGGGERERDKAIKSENTLLIYPMILSVAVQTL
jgi:hypothetical protein